MAANEVTRDDVQRLPHQKSVQFASQCARIIWETLWPSLWPSRPQQVEDALLEVERLGKLPIVQAQDKKKINELISGLPLPLGAPATHFLMQAIELAAQAALSEHQQGARVQLAAERAYEAYREAWHAAIVASNHVPTAKADFLDKAKAVYDALFNSP
jgi:hypothetical protein